MHAGVNAVANGCFRRALTYTTPGTRRLDLSKSEAGDRLFIFRATIRFRCKHAAKSVNHISLIAIDYVSVRGLHFETITGGPGTAAQYSPIATTCIVALVSVEAPLPNVAAEIE